MIILLKWHEIHDNGLFSSSVTAGNLRSVQDPTPRAAPVWEDKPQTLNFNWNLNFPRRSGVLGSVTGPGALVQPQGDHPNLFQQREDISVHHLHPAAPEWPSNNWEQVQFTFYFKKKGEVHTWGENGVNNNYLKAGFHHCAPQLPPAWEQRALQAHPLALTAQPGLAAWKPLGSRGRWKQWDHTQGECVGHSFWFKWWNAPAGGRGGVNSY